MRKSAKSRSNHSSLARLCSVILLMICAGLSVHGQTVSGRISGTVKDKAGAVIPNAAVTITNTATNLVRTATADDRGYYTATNLPVGTYTVVGELKGFKKAIQGDNVLTADAYLTVDITLEPGEITETVQVTSASMGETVNTTSGEVARVIDQEQVENLALNGRNYMQLTTLIPGAPLLSDDQLGLMTGLGTSQPINGTRGNQNLLTVDGGFNLDSGSNSSQINNVGIDFIREVNIKTSNFSAEYGRNSGSSINVVTRSGSNTFHGSVFEFLRNDALDANSFINNARGVAKPKLRYNNFGGSLGGPIIKDKFFIFGGLEWKLIRRTSATGLLTIPTGAERNGDFSFRLRGADGIVGTDDDGVLRDPTKLATTCTARVLNSDGTVKTPANRTGCFGGTSVALRNIIPSNLFTTDGKAMAAVYAAMAKQAAFNNDALTANNVLFQLPNPFHFKQEILRLDYRFNERHSLYGRYLHDDYNLDDPFGAFITSALPTIPNNRRRPGYGYQVSHTWMIAPTLINEAKASASWNGQRVIPIGDVWKRETYGFTFQQLFTGGGRFENSIPDATVSGFASFDGAARSLLSPTTDISLSDNLTWVHGNHTLKTGGLIIRNRKDQNGRTRYAGQLSFNASGNPNTTNNAFADALLGNFRTYTEFSSDPIGFYRFSQYEAFVSDSWRFNRRLSLELGLRYQYGLPTYTQANNIANFDPRFYNPAQAVTIIGSTGLIDPTRGGNRFNGLVRAGNGVPPEEVGRVVGATDPVTLSVPAGAPRGLYKPQHLFAPRVGFAYTPQSNNKMSIRGGIGIFYDRPEGNLVFPMTGLPPYSLSSQLENGNLANLAAAKAAAPAPFGDIDAIDPNLVVPSQIGYSLSVQRELPWGIFGEISYVGNVGRNLIRQPDINQPTFQALADNQLLPSASRLSTNALRPYKGFAQIRMRLSDASSNYNALQVYANKRKGDLSLTVSYTWSKTLANSSGNTDNIEAGDDPFNPASNYGPVSFDRRHIFVTTYTYRVPLFRKSRALLSKTLGGWEASGITRWQTGQYLTPTGSTSIGTRRADYLGGDLNVRSTDPLGTWFNTAAFATAPNDRRGTAGVGIIQGPGRYLWDISVRKRLSAGEKVRLQFQADFFNAFNMLNLNNPNVTTSSSAFGTISGTAPGRNIQLGFKLTF